MCGFNGADRCDVCIFDMKSSKHPKKCLISVCTKLSAKDKKECIRQYDRLLSDHMKVPGLSEGADVFCSWHVNGVRSNLHECYGSTHLTLLNCVCLLLYI
jgi:hypothetical protein